MTARRLGVGAALVDGELLPGDVEVTDERVTRVGLPAAAGGRIAAPGYIDLQVNGFAGVDVMGADEDGLRHVDCALAQHGVTSWLPTLITASPAQVERALGVLARHVGSADRAGARPLGVHLEGPFLSPRRLGTHPAEHRLDPDPGLVRRWRGLGPVVAATVAPELPGAHELVRDLSADGVLVSLGHSDATAEQAHAGFDAGARTVTHLFNAMSPLHHRAPGLPGAALARPDVVVQLVIDGHHLHDDAVGVAWAAARGRIVMVTDATAAAGLEDGSYALAGVPVEVCGGAVRNRDGALAGSALSLDAAVRNAVALGADLTDTLCAVTEAPARLLGRDDLGRLRPGARADLVVLDDRARVVQTWVEGSPTETGRPVTRHSVDAPGERP
jgi:N-acetylglucosamine-6-phosphate deacetylase